MALPLRDDAPSRRVPWMTYLLLAANVMVFLFLQPAALQGTAADSSERARQEAEVNSYFYEWGAIPCEIQHLEALSEGIACSGERDTNATLAEDKVVLLSLLTCMFIHGSLVHLAGNMLFLFIFGRNVEDRVGPVPFLGLYLLTGVLATLGHALFNWDDPVPVVGASGAIAGVMGAYLVFRPRARILALVFWTVVYVPAWVLLGLFFVTQFLTPDSEGVAWIAHAVGMVGGVACAAVLARTFRDPDAPTPIRAPRAIGADWVLPAGPPSS
ncbi:MAG: rhomboid family intramembrane serine protease [Acidimicrobiales bacterium]